MFNANAYKTVFKYMELGRYLKRFHPDQMIYLCSESFFVHAPVYSFYHDFRNLLRLEVCYCEHNPFTVYL